MNEKGKAKQAKPAAAPSGKKAAGFTAETKSTAKPAPAKASKPKR